MSDSLPLHTTLEALLFYKGEPDTIAALSKTLKASPEETQAAIEELKVSLEGRGIVLVQNDEQVELRTCAEASALIEEIRKQELSKDLGKAGAETLAIILYQGPISRADIDYIRGVNSSFILRNLQIRGLIERASDPKNGRSFLYAPTVELLAHLGVTEKTSLPEYHVVQSELKTFADERGGDDGSGEHSGE